MRRRLPGVPLVLGVLCMLCAGAAPSPATQPVERVAESIGRILEMLRPADGRAFSAKLTLNKSQGLPSEARGAVVQITFAGSEDRLRIDASVNGDKHTISRDGQRVWAHIAAKKFAMLGTSGIARFSADPHSIDRTVLPRMNLAITPQQVGAALLMFTVAELEPRRIEGETCRVMRLVPGLTARLMGLPAGVIELTIRDKDGLPVRMGYRDGKAMDVELAVDVGMIDAREANWKPGLTAGDHVETVALSHLLRFVEVAAANMQSKAAPLPPARGEKRLVARSGEGRLELWDGTRVLFLKGTPAEMGKQHGKLLQKEVREVSGRILYGVGVGSSLVKGSWFFGEIERAQARLAPFVSKRHWEEMDALADAAGLNRQEMRLANLFPELFHCSGFAVMKSATVDGKLYHGRVLDYLRGVGLEQNAVVMVVRPDEGNAWVNVGYAGFIGSVTAMNEKHIAIGEMGGRGEGNWDGKPMAQLVREVMEQADTLEQAVEIIRKGPRTCEYHYVISDGKTGKAVAIRGTPTEFEMVHPGEAHPLLPDVVEDAVLLSAGDRYKELVRRVKAGHGRLDADSARALMDPPVCMTSNIQSVLFAPQSLDFWVANADSANVASQTRYTKYNLGQMLER